MQRNLFLRDYDGAKLSLRAQAQNQVALGDDKNTVEQDQLPSLLAKGDNTAMADQGRKVV